MASLGMGMGMGFGAAAAAGGSRVVKTGATAATKTTGGGGEEKGLLDWILGGLQKKDQLLETDPILKKVEQKSGGTGTAARRSGGTTSVSRGTTSVSVPDNGKKSGGFFGGLFAKE